MRQASRRGIGTRTFGLLLHCTSSCRICRFLPTRASVDEIGTHALMAAGISEGVHRPLISAETASALARCLAVSEIAVGDYDRNAFPDL